MIAARNRSRPRHRAGTDNALPVVLAKNRVEQAMAPARGNASSMASRPSSIRAERMPFDQRLVARAPGLRTEGTPRRRDRRTAASSRR